MIFFVSDDFFAEYIFIHSSIISYCKSFQLEKKTKKEFSPDFYAVIKIESIFSLVFQIICAEQYIGFSLIRCWKNVKSWWTFDDWYIFPLHNLNYNDNLTRSYIKIYFGHSVNQKDRKTHVICWLEFFEIHRYIFIQWENKNYG